MLVKKKSKNTVEQTAIDTQVENVQDENSVDMVDDDEFSCEEYQDYEVPEEERTKVVTFVDEDFGEMTIDLNEQQGIVDFKDNIIIVEEDAFEGIVDDDGFYTIETKVNDEKTQTEVVVKKKFKVKKVKKKYKRHKNDIIIGVMREASFGELLPFIRDINVTDINWNGRQLWIDDVTRGRYKSDVVLTDEFVKAFAIRVSNVVSKSFNKYSSILEAETDELRITVVHESASGTGRAISIRKTPAIKRIKFKESIEDGSYCSKEVANLMSNSVKAKMNIIVCGLPGVGKTELVKYLTNYIFPEDRVITIEDTYEIHYSKTNPDKDCLELKVLGDTFTYTDAIKASVRLLPQWILLSEARSTEVQYLIESVSTGAKCMTTLHTDDVRKIPDRILNMLDINAGNQDTILNQIYSFFDLGILIEKEQDNVTGEIKRYISQICMFSRHDGENDCTMLVDNKERVVQDIPKYVLDKYHKAGIINPFEYQFVKR